ncbi:MAG TPA: hypothetical protein VNO83_00030 [Pseudonocardia sp.]|nr:hypothetical protein [Pseudonocardia sp.]
MTNTQRAPREGRRAQTAWADTPGRRTLRRLDVGAALTAAGFLALGVLSGFQLLRLTGLGSGLLDAAAALDQAGRAMSGLARLPIVGPTTGMLADGVQQAAGSARTTATDAVAAIRQLAVLVAVAIALIPMPLLLGAYLPLRRHWARSLRTGHWS